ncbi:MAG TPA: TetR family transcriptional regulator C-terminal domain-containing protein [Firmicutes bacterium]|nr:TetR family transcriptional regulator C-terminal domain-containing protein [Bacillota bacterium]
MTNEEWSFKTKQALAFALKDTMEKKRLSKITVSELIAICHVNRKTFYYHFRDIPDLLKWMFEQEARDVMGRFALLSDAEEAIRFVMDYVDRNKHIINGAYDAMGYEEIKRFFYTDLFSVIHRTIESGEQELKVTLDPQFKGFLAAFYTEAAAGLMLEWIRHRMTQDKEMVLHNLLSVFRVSIPAVLRANGCGSREIKPQRQAAGPQ